MFQQHPSTSTHYHLKGCMSNQHIQLFPGTCCNNLLHLLLSLPNPPCYDHHCSCLGCNCTCQTGHIDAVVREALVLAMDLGQEVLEGSELEWVHYRCFPIRHTQCSCIEQMPLHVGFQHLWDHLNSCHRHLAMHLGLSYQVGRNCPATTCWHNDHPTS